VPRSAAAILIGCLLATAAPGATLEEVVARRDADFAAGRPLVAHVVVALCDNEFQGIVPVPASLGNGADPRMAPEAYTLDAALMRWFSGGDPDAVRRAAAQAYARYQKTSEQSALRLFRTPATVRAP